MRVRNGSRAGRRAGAAADSSVARCALLGERPLSPAVSTGRSITLLVREKLAES